MSDIVVVGSINQDRTYRVERLPRPGETIACRDVVLNAGGKGANQAVAAARCGASVAMLGCVGDDDFGRAIVKALQDEGIDMSGTRVLSDVPSGSALVFVGDDGENSIVIQGGANSRLTPQMVESREEQIGAARYVLLQNEIPLESGGRAAELAAKTGKTVIWNPAPAQGVTSADLANVDILTPNRTEAESLVGIPVLDDETAAMAARRLHDAGVGIVLITMGPDGVWCSADGEAGRVPGFPVRPVDTTGAGDAFNGSLAASLSSGSSLREAIVFGQAAAALAIMKAGAQSAVPCRKEVLDFLSGS